MTNEDLKAIRARADAATPGPWQGSPAANFVVLAPDGRRVADTEWMVPGSIAQVLMSPRIVGDVAFIAHAREDIPALLDEVERLHAEIATFKSDKDNACK